MLIERPLSSYIDLIRSKLDYGCFIYGAARKSYLQRLETIHHQGLRLTLGAFNTSPKESLYIEPPHYLRRQKLALQYYIKLISCPQNPAYDYTGKTKYENLYQNNPPKIRPFSLRISDLLNEIKINTKIVHHTILSKTAPWTIRQPTINLELAKLPKTKTHPITYQEKLIEIQNKFPDHYHIYTDGSKRGKKSRLCCYFSKKETLKRLPNEASIYSAETTAIDLAMNIIANHKASKFIIYTDSKSVLLALQSRDTSSPLITKLLNKLNTLCKNNIIFTWIPSHIWHPRKWKSRQSCKKSSSNWYVQIKNPIYRSKTNHKEIYIRQMAEIMGQSDPKKLHKIQEAIGEWPTGYRREVILARLRIGHTHITHSHLLKGEVAPVCPSCKVQLTTKHILLNCNNLKHIRTKYYQARNLRDIFKNTNPENIFDFLKKKSNFSARYNQTSL